MPAGNPCSGFVGIPFKQFYLDILTDPNGLGLTEANAVLHVTSADSSHRINKGFPNPSLGCNGSSNNFLLNFGTAAVRTTTYYCMRSDANNFEDANPGEGCDFGFNDSDYGMFDNNHVTVNRTCGQCGWGTQSLEGVSDNNYSGGAGNFGFCPNNLCTVADLGTTIDANHKLLYDNAVHAALGPHSGQAYKIFINQLQDNQNSANVSPRCTDLIGGFIHGSVNVQLIQDEDGFEDTGQDESTRYRQNQWAFAINSASCVLYNNLAGSTSTWLETHQVDNYLQTASGHPGCSGAPCPQSVINTNRLNYLSLLWLYYEPGKTPAGQEVVENGGQATGDHFVLSSFPEYYIIPTGPLETMSIYEIPYGTSPNQDGSGCSSGDSYDDHGTDDLLVHNGATPPPSSQSASTCGYSGLTVPGTPTNTNKLMGAEERQYTACYQYQDGSGHPATMTQALTRTGTYVNIGPCATYVVFPQTNLDSSHGQKVPCSASIGTHPFAALGIGDNSVYGHMMTLASYGGGLPAGGFMGVGSNDPGANTSAGDPADQDTNYTRANGPVDANPTGSVFACGSTTIAGGTGALLFQ